MECGRGLHFCHYPICCEQFGEIKHYLACEIEVKNIRIYNKQPLYPDKFRAQKARVLYEVDRWGKKLQKRDKNGKFAKS